MAKLKMQKLRIVALSRDRKRVLERLQRLGLVEPSEPAEDEVLCRLDTSGQQAQFDEALKTIDAALDVLEEYAPEKKPFLAGFRPRGEITDDEYAAVLERSEQTMSVCRNIVGWKKEIAELNADNIRSQTRVDQLAPWLGLDVPVNFKGTSRTSALIGTVTAALDDDSLLAELAAACPEVEALDAEVISSSGDMSCISVLCLKKDQKAVERALRGMGFAQLSEQGKKTPAEMSEQITAQMNERDEQAAKLKEQIIAAADSRREMQLLHGCYEMRTEKYKVIGQLASGESVFILEGWTLESKYEKVAGEMEKLGAYCEKAEPDKNEEEPVALKSNGFTEGGAPVVEMFALPSKNDIDPTPAVAFFYYLLFGIMLGDAAYGLIMAIATGFVMLKLKPEAPQRRTMKLFFFSGISSIIWGVLFGSYFGNLPNAIGETFFGVSDVVKPILFDPIADAMSMMYLSVALGAVHVLFGVALGVVTAIKNKDAAAAIFDYLAWLTLVLGIIAYALISVVGGSLPFTVPDIVTKVILGVTVASAVAILLMGGRDSKNFFKRILKGAYALYGISGYLSDFMSYSRILALGLATGVISQVFNQMAMMVGGSGKPVAIVLMIVVLVVGHLFNIGISLIGCYVHTARLQFVEFFGKFYEGGGRGFAPLAADTKYFKFKEENQ